jgi:hypothetical protein
MRNVSFFALSLATLFIIFTYASTTFGQAIVTDEGYISLTGYVDTVQNDSFTIIVNDDDRVDVVMEPINQQTLDNLIDSDILKRDAYVTVRGSLIEDVTGVTIEAETIDVLTSEYNEYN